MEGVRHRMSRPLVAISLTGALDGLGIALIFPMLPVLVRSLNGPQGASEMFGAMLALYAFMQFVFAPVLGALSDRYGRRPVLLLSLAGSAIDYLIMAFTPCLWPLFIGRAIAGLTAANQAVAAAYITDITPEAERASRFGMFTACFSVGFVAGPVIGGALSDLSPQLGPFLGAAVLNGINLAIALFILPESHAPESKPIAWRTLNPLAPLRWALTVRPLVPLLTLFLLVSLVSQTYVTVWVLFVENRFHWSADEIGLSLTVYGVLVAVAQGGVTGPLTRAIGERGALLVGIACDAGGLLVLSFAQSSWMAFAAVPLLAFGGVGQPALKSLQANAVDRWHQGELQGVVASFVSLATFFGPIIFGGIYALSQAQWPGLVWMVGAAVCAVAAPVALSVPGRAKRPS